MIFFGIKSNEEKAHLSNDLFVRASQYHNKFIIARGVLHQMALLA